MVKPKMRSMLQGSLPLGVSAVGERIGKEFENDDGEVELFMGTVSAFLPEPGSTPFTTKTATRRRWTVNNIARHTNYD